MAFVVDHQLRIVLWNESLAANSGIPVEVALGQPVFEVVPELALAGDEALIRAALDGTTTTAPGRPSPFPDAPSRGLEVTYFPLREEAGEIVGACCALREIIASPLDTTLEASAESFSSLFEGSAEAMVINDNGILVAVNGAYLDLIGYERHEVIGQPSVRFVATDDQTTVVTNMQSGLERAYEAGVRRRDGSTVPVEVLGRAIVYRNRVMRLSTMRDITERRRAQAELHRREQEFRTLTENSPDIVTRFDRDARYVYVNPAIVGATGRQPDDFIGKTLAESGIGRDLAASWTTAVATVFATGELQELEFQYMAPTGIRAYHARLAPQFAPNGEVEYVLAVTREVTMQYRIAEDLRRQSLHDPLTGLPNRTLFNDRLTTALARAARRAGSVAVLFIDLDRFKQINDTYGHEIGDEFLVAVSRRLGLRLRDEDTLARLGGDEFAVVLPVVNEIAEASEAAGRLLRALDTPLYIQGLTLQANASIGIALSTVETADAAGLLREADAALYTAKAAGRGQFALFAGTGNAGITTADLARDLRAALEGDDLELRWQPIVRLDTGRVEQRDVTVLWTHARLGVLDDAQVHEMASRTGLETELGRWILRAACRLAAQDVHVGVSVGVSDGYLRAPDFVCDVASALATVGMNAALLEIEIDERTLEDDSSHLADVLAALRRMGVAVTVDHFGTGYLSLAHLRHLPLSAVKLDRSYTDDLGRKPGTQAAVESLVVTAQAMGLAVIADGVDSDERRNLVRLAGFDLAQGMAIDPERMLITRESGAATDFLVALAGD
jgi:diguanylate cyclase (GGDEF)-like protein/PAS domain S-box-containing protein